MTVNKKEHISVSMKILTYFEYLKLVDIFIVLIECGLFDLVKFIKV